MDTTTIFIIIAVLVVVAVVVGVVLSRSGDRRAEAGRAKAAEIREDAAEQGRDLREREASAAEAKAKSELAAAQAQKQQVEAERLEDEARARTQSAGVVREEHDEKLREADQHDPDVRTDDDGNRLAEGGDRSPGDSSRQAGSLDHTDDHREDQDGTTVQGRDDRPVRGEHMADDEPTTPQRRDDENV